MSIKRTFRPDGLMPSSTVLVFVDYDFFITFRDFSLRDDLTHVFIITGRDLASYYRPYTNTELIM